MIRQPDDETGEEIRDETTDAALGHTALERRRRAQLLLAAVLMGVSGIMLVVTAVWALTFEGSLSRELRRALNGDTLTSAGVVVLVIGVLLLACSVGSLVGAKVNRWLALASRVIGAVIGAAGAVTGLWFVGYYPGWAVTYTVLGGLIVYTLTLYERELPSSWPWSSLRAQLAKVFALNTKGVYVPRGVAVAGLLLVTLVVTSAVHLDRYFLSVAFGLVFVSLSDPGGPYLVRFRRMAAVAIVGTLLTALGFGIGGDAWGYVVLAAFFITVLGGLAVNFGLEALVAGVLLNVWFFISLSAVAGLPARVTARPWNQALAWLSGSAISVVLMSGLWLVRGRSQQPSPLPEIPTDLPRVQLSRPVVTFALIRAVAVAGSVAIAFGLNATNADWMPIATLIALKPTVQQSALRAAQRIVGAVLGAAIAAVFLVAVTSHRALEEIVILLMGLGVSIYMVNYALYAAAIAGAALVALDVFHPTTLAAEGRRVFFTFAGVAIAVAVLFLASLLQKRAARASGQQGSDGVAPTSSSDRTAATEPRLSR